MNIEKFELKIQHRANEEAQAAIRSFREEVRKSLRTLFCVPNAAIDVSPAKEAHIRKALEVLVLGNDVAKWPPEIWHRREKALRDEVLLQMDVVQRTLSAQPPGANDERCESVF